MTKVVCIGECMMELCPRPDGSYDLAFAGDAFNAAVYLKRSAPQFTVRFLTATGIDRFSFAMRKSWRVEGIDEGLAFTVDGANPGLYVISLDEKGERSFAYWRTASPARRWLELLLREGGAKKLADADLVYISGISLAILPDDQRDAALDFLADVRKCGCKIAFDPNYRPALWSSPAVARRVLGSAMELAHISLPSHEDLNSAALTVPARGECVTTCGADGCWVTTGAARTFVRSPAIVGSAVRDTSGAGDAFTGAYLASRLSGCEPAAAARSALAVASRVVTAWGALVPKQVSHPTPPVK